MVSWFFLMALQKWTSPVFLVFFLKLSTNGILKIYTEWKFLLPYKWLFLLQMNVRSLCPSDLHLGSALKVNRTDQIFHDHVIEILRDQRFNGNTKFGFIVKQLTLIFKLLNGRRYSCLLLATISLLQGTSPVCYKQL